MRLTLDLPDYTNFFFCFFAAVSFSIVSIGCNVKSAPVQAKMFSDSIVWERNEGGIPERFVYGLAVANDGTILSFAEGRIATGDASPHHIVLKRSKDNGATWMREQKVVSSEQGECYANPTPVVDKSTGHIFLFYARNYANDYSDVFYLVSKDHGDSWSAAEKVTGLFANDPLKRPFHLPGPGHGIQLSGGRLLVQVWHRFSVNLPSRDRHYGVSVIYSDDHGKTWKEGGYVPPTDDYPVNESRLFELNGEVIMNGRYASTGTHQRIQSNSKDGGITWGDPYLSSLPAFTSVDAGVNLLTDKNKSYLLITRPIDLRARKDLAISVSEDGGKSWPITKLIYEGPANYSDVVVLPDKSILVLYGRGTPRYAASARFTLSWLKKK